MRQDMMELTGLTLAELEQLMRSLDEPAYRARQLRDWLIKGRGLDGMGNLPASLLDKLQPLAIAQPARVLERHESKTDGTQKLLFGLPDGHTVEGVIMRYRHGITFCLSTQVGCAMGCAFCASTLQGKLRDLSAGEMASMCYLANQSTQPEPLSNLVLMGSGEPLDNYDQVLAFLRLITSRDSLHIGARHISLSTCGLPDKMRSLAREGLPITLSVSLHAPNDQVRRSIMPIARAYSMDEVLDACRDYISQTGRRVVFEYALIDSLNDQPAHARELAGRLRGMQCHVNLIPLNDVPERQLRASGKEQAAQFQRILGELHISATIRRQLGDDIFGACGQLRVQRLKTSFVDHSEVKP